MSNVHHLRQEPAPEPKDKARGPYRSKITKTEIERTINTARDLGLTIYGVTVCGDKIHLQTQPSAKQDPGRRTEVDQFFGGANV